MTRTDINGIPLPDLPPPQSYEVPLARFASEADLDARIAALPADAVIISYRRTTSRHASHDGCRRGAVDQVRRGMGEPCEIPARPADLGWCWVALDGYASESRAVWLDLAGLNDDQLRAMADWRDVAAQDREGQMRVRAAQAELAHRRVGHRQDCRGCASGHHPRESTHEEIPVLLFNPK